MSLSQSPTAVKHRTAWRVFVATAAPDQQTPENWAMFLAGWAARGDYERGLKARG